MSKPKVLVTGGTGKTGSRLVRRLREQDWPVRLASRSGKAPDGVEAARFDWLTVGLPPRFPAVETQSHRPDQDDKDLRGLVQLANQAAMDAANAQAAAANAANAANEANAVADNTTNPKEADEQNVSGM